MNDDETVRLERIDGGYVGFAAIGFFEDTQIILVASQMSGLERAWTSLGIEFHEAKTMTVTASPLARLSHEMGLGEEDPAFGIMLPYLVLEMDDKDGIKIRVERHVDDELGPTTALSELIEGCLANDQFLLKSATKSETAVVLSRVESYADAFRHLELRCRDWLARNKPESR